MADYSIKGTVNTGEGVSGEVGVARGGTGGGVSSVNGKTGVVVLSTADIEHVDGNSVQTVLEGIGQEQAYFKQNIVPKVNANEEAIESLNENYVSLSDRTETLESALLGLDSALTGLEGAIGL